EGMDREVPHMIDVVTTNKTDFFREPSHFDLLYDEILPEWLAAYQGNRNFSVWSAGCSTGEEPYSLAMILDKFAANHPDFNFDILGTDISNQVLEKARQAIYPETKVEAVPHQLKKNCLLRSRDRVKKQVRIVPALRKKVTFRRLNLMEQFSWPGTKDVIFCRNVIIYFERPVQEELFKKCCNCLKKGGYLFIGHSETLSGMRLPLQQRCPTVYERI
ncbi:MAG: CheR family methyltransferase, partial [Desulfosudaceae bacterium]